MQNTDFINPEMAEAINRSPVFASLKQELEYEREKQKMKYQYIYGFADTIVGQTSKPILLTIEQGSDFKCVAMTASAYSYDTVNASSFPIPNALGATAWAGRGVQLSITDAGAGRELTSSYIPIELLGAPGYGLNFQNPYPFRYLFKRTSIIRFDVRNLDVATRTHAIAIALLGFKTLTPA